MKKTRQMHPGGFYLFSGKSSANSSFIEDKQEAIEFISRCNKKLDGFLVIHDFNLSKDGWQLLVELGSEDAIQKLYKKKIKKSRQISNRNILKTVWKIISEQIRGILSNFVVYTNRKNGRKGSKVARSYERYFFESITEAKNHLDKMRRQLIKMSQRLRKYQATKTHFRISKNEIKGAVFLCSKYLEQSSVRQCFGEGCINLLKNRMHVLSTLVKSTFLTHNRSKMTVIFTQIE